MIDFACYLPEPGAYGWGRCSEWVVRHLADKGVECHNSYQSDAIETGANVVLSALSDHRFQYTSNVMGKKNVGYGFIENNIAGEKMAYYGNRLWDSIVCGSTWMKEWLEPLVDIPISVAIQGIQTAEFSYADQLEGKPFTIGSFGKFEFRKGQDIAIKAMAIFQERHPEVCLNYNWHNQWPVLMRQFAWSAHSKIRMSYSLDDGWYKENEFGFFANTLENAKVKNGKNVSNWWMSYAYRSCDVILFPNRCEAGTNLCLMEALACGVPCIATDATGHTDITRNEDYPCKNLLLTCGSPKTFYQGDYPLGNWHDPCLDEVVSKLEQAYRQRDELASRRKAISRFGQKFKWEDTANSLYDAMVKVRVQ